MERLYQKKQNNLRQKKKSRLLRPSKNLPAQNCLNFPVRKTVQTRTTTTRSQSGKNYLQWENFM